MIRFVWPWLFLLLPLPWLLRRLLPASREGGGAALQVPYYERLSAAVGAVRAVGGPRVLRMLAYLAWLLLIVAAAQPQWVDSSRGLPASGRDLMLVVDISGSMRTMDFAVDREAVDRLTVVKRVASRFVAGRGGDRVGLILFGAQPHLWASPTHDLGAVRQLLEEAEIALAGEYTALGDAIGLAVKRMRGIASESRVAVVLTDGVSNAGALTAEQGARLAASEGVRVYTIGIGREDVVAPHPYGTWSSEGAERFNRAALEGIARATGGLYFHALDTAGLEQAYRRLDALEPALGEAIHDYVATPLYPWLLAVVLALSVPLALMRVRWS